ncbi:hypothetical protein BS50DRAFT_305164 [Corynespora cassiicola Philippines]|uniref:Uncharacterized protein n=1 Tax=Corynespora cassiicola Philippines TaxID=1448308 RepID=A0A2T2NXF9_CORCC|nr:hypothetical protein BS50DRAFT_305164 [Corynespora cassiicola Philippines]
MEGMPAARPTLFFRSFRVAVAVRERQSSQQRCKPLRASRIGRRRAQNRPRTPLPTGPNWSQLVPKVATLARQLGMRRAGGNTSRTKQAIRKAKIITTRSLSNVPGRISQPACSWQGPEQTQSPTARPAGPSHGEDSLDNSAARRANCIWVHGRALQTHRQRVPAGKKRRCGHGGGEGNARGRADWKLRVEMRWKPGRSTGEDAAGA